MVRLENEDDRLDSYLNIVADDPSPCRPRRFSFYYLLSGPRF